MELSQSILRFKSDLRHVCSIYNQPEPLVVAVSKDKSLGFIQEAYKAGLDNFGESYWQEAKIKIKSLEKLALTWHFIGTIQSNKAKDIANNFSWIHSLDREKIAELLSKYRNENFSPLNICIQVNLSSEPQKAGIKEDQLYKLATCIQELPRLKLRGLMGISNAFAKREEVYESFNFLKILKEKLSHDLKIELDTLSMGMSDDYEEAIRAGATILRIGKAIFGERG